MTVARTMIACASCIELERRVANLEDRLAAASQLLTEMLGPLRTITDGVGQFAGLADEAQQYRSRLESLERWTSDRGWRPETRMRL